jgi:hypothetical protein
MSHWVWETDDSNKGDNKIEVWIRDEKHADESSYDDSRSASFAIQSQSSEILYRFSRNEKWLIAPNVPTTGEQVELKLEPIPSGNINKYQWWTNLEPNLIGIGNPIYYTFKRAGNHEITVDVIYQDKDKISFKRNLQIEQP